MSGSLCTPHRTVAAKVIAGFAHPADGKNYPQMGVSAQPPFPDESLPRRRMLRCDSMEILWCPGWYRARTDQVRRPRALPKSGGEARAIRKSSRPIALTHRAAKTQITSGLSRSQDASVGQVTGTLPQLPITLLRLARECSRNFVFAA